MPNVYLMIIVNLFQYIVASLAIAVEY